MLVNLDCHTECQWMLKIERITDEQESDYKIPRGNSFKHPRRLSQRNWMLVSLIITMDGREC